MSDVPAVNRGPDCPECGQQSVEPPVEFRPAWANLACAACRQNIVVKDRHENVDGSPHDCRETGVVRCARCGLIVPELAVKYIRRAVETELMITAPKHNPTIADMQRFLDGVYPGARVEVDPKDQSQVLVKLPLEPQFITIETTLDLGSIDE